jgi:hypothetical protein
VIFVSFHPGKENAKFAPQTKQPATLETQDIPTSTPGERRAPGETAKP